MKHTELRNKASGTDTLTSARISLVETWSREYQTKVDFVHWHQKNRFLLSQYMLILIYHREMFARLSSTTCAICAWYWDDVVLHCWHRSTINVFLCSVGSDTWTTLSRRAASTRAHLALSTCSVHLLIFRQCARAGAWSVTDIPRWRWWADDAVVITDHVIDRY